MRPATNAEIFQRQERRERKEFFGYKPQRTQSTQRYRAPVKNLFLAETAETAEEKFIL